jgi:phosphatidylserine/phosphatidylglycerophosphate/cardiolipin synthase-like enzyme
MLLFIILAILAFVGLWHSNKPMPQGLNFHGKSIAVTEDQIEFLADLSYRSTEGEPARQQQIFPTLFKLIDEAQQYILIDFFLFNDQTRQQNTSTDVLAAKLVDHLIAAKKKRPELIIDVITDPINTMYGATSAKELQRLADADIQVIITNLTPLRDSNPLYSTLWRLLLRWIPEHDHLLPHPFDSEAENVSLASGLRLLNFKANHRKVALLDHHGVQTAMICSANPHGGSSRHSNVAIQISNNRFAEQIYHSEQAVAKLSGATLRPLPQLGENVQKRRQDKTLEITLLTEEAIGSTLKKLMATTQTGDSIHIAVFYLADRQIIKTLVDASQRGVDIEIILDTNLDAFGYKKNGVPNHPVAAELTARSENKIKIRWYKTHGEQFHSKMTLIQKKSGTSYLLTGSANLTRRNLCNFNLETNILISGPSTAQPLATAHNYYERIWNNHDGQFTVGYKELMDNSASKSLQYRLQEATGLGTF